MRISSFETALTFVLLAYLCLIMFPLYTLERPVTLEDLESPKTVASGWSVGAILLIAGADLLFLSRFVSLAKSAFRGSLAVSALIFLFVCAGITGAVTMRPLVVADACVAIFLVINWSVFWCCSDQARARFWRYGSYLIAAFMIFSVIIHGPPVDRWIGGIHPNIMGGYGLALCSFALIMTGRHRGTLFLLGIAASLIVSSRYALVGSIVVLSSVLLRDYFSKSRNARLLVMTGTTMSILAIIFGWDIIADVMRLDSVGRGISSGLGGRIETWGNFWPQFKEALFAGYGFRNRAGYVGTHNGYLNTLIELGALMGGAMILLMFGGLIRLFGWAARDRGREAIGVSSALMGLLIVASLQPQIINFGDAFGYVSLMLLSVPLLTSREVRPVESGQKGLLPGHARPSEPVLRRKLGDSSA